MGWFSKKEKRPEISQPKLPDLPRLPDLPPMNEGQERLPQLPSFPASSTGDRFSQSAIKEAVTGEKEVDDEDEADEFEGTMPITPQENIPMTRDIEETPSRRSVPKEFKDAAKVVKEAEPVFIRIDKYEKSLEVFEKAKEKVMDIEKMLKDIKDIKEKEDQELSAWEKEIQETREQIERVDKELFSKIE